jgi:hypothetical protein
VDRGEEALTEVARSFAVSHMTISRIKAACGGLAGGVPTRCIVAE